MREHLLIVLNHCYRWFIWTFLRRRVSVHDNDKRSATLRATIKRKKEMAGGTPRLL